MLKAKVNSNSGKFATKWWPTSLSNEGEAVVVQGELAAVGLDVQRELEVLTPTDDQPLISEKLCVVVAVVAPDVQVIAFQLQGCVHGGGSDCHFLGPQFRFK